MRKETVNLVNQAVAKNQRLMTRLLLLSLLDHDRARLCLSFINDLFSSVQRMYRRIKSRHVSGVIFDQRPRPGIFKIRKPQVHLKEDRPTLRHRQLIFLNHQG